MKTNSTKDRACEATGKRPRLLHMFNSFLIGGVEKQHIQLVERMQARFEQECWALDDGPLSLRLRGMGIAAHCGPASLAREVIERGGFDCVVLRTNRILKDLSAFLREWPVPVVYTRNYLRWSVTEEHHINMAYEHLGLEAADRCLFSGPSLKEPLRHIFPPELGGEIIYNGLGLDRFPMKARKAPTAGRPLRVGMLANLLPNKNQLAAVEALRTGLGNSQYELFLAGAPFDAAYAECVAEAARGLPVHILGRVEDSVTFLREVDVLLVASTLEGWPNAIMEAFASGVPVISTNVGDIKALFGGKAPGRLYPVHCHGQIPSLLEEVRCPGEYERLSRLAVSRAADFDIVNSVAQLERTILDVIAESRAASGFGETAQ